MRKPLSLPFNGIGGGPSVGAVKDRWRAGWAAQRSLWLAVLLSLNAGALMLPYVFQWESRDEGVRNVINWLPGWRSLEALEYRLYDARFVKRGPIRPQSWNKIAIIGIDERSLEDLKDLGPWPFPHRWHAQVIRRLQKAGARVIALDIDTSSRSTPKDDAALASAMQDAKTAGCNVLLGSYLAPEGDVSDAAESTVQDPKFGLFLTKTPPENLDLLTPDVSLNYTPIDSDGSVRRYSFRARINDSDAGSLATLAAASFQKQLGGATPDGTSLNPRYDNLLRRERWPSSDGLVYQVPLSSIQLGNGDAPRVRTMLVNFWGPQGSFETTSFSQVMGFSSFDQEHKKAMQNGLDEARLRRLFQNRIVFIGATAHILKDSFPAPAFRDQNDNTFAASLPGVELIASSTAMLLDGVYIRAVSTRATVFFTFALALISGVWGALLGPWAGRTARRVQDNWKKRKRPGRIYGPVWFFCYVPFSVLPIFAFWHLGRWFFENQRLWVIMTYPIVGGILSSGLVLMLLFSVEASERRKAITQFSRLVAPDVVDEILAHPEDDYPRPRRVHATILFTDLMGFTSYSEEREPEEVVDVLDAYLARMRPIIYAHGGSIDKFIGDAIMVWFGAPIPRIDHAAQALHCSIAMQHECARFREETGIPFYMRVGVHTGDLIAGCIGDGQQINYTVIGDTVNLASRLESKNKEFGSWVMCSRETYEAAPDVACVESARTQIKGKAGMVDVLIVRGLKEDGPCDQLWGDKHRDALEDEGQPTLTEHQDADARPAPSAEREDKALPSPALALPAASDLGVVEVESAP